MDEVIRYNVEGDGYLFYEAKEGDWIKAEDLDALQQKLTNLNKELEEYRSIAEKVGATKAVSDRDKARDILTSLVKVVGEIKLPQNMAAAALLVSTVGAVLKRAQDFLSKEVRP